MSSYNLTLNNTNVVNTQNNTFQYNFIQGSVEIPEGATISVSQITVPYSWRNITATLGNNQWSYILPSGASGTTTYGPYTIPDGFYTYNDLNTLFQVQFRTNGHYWYIPIAANGTSALTYFYPFTLSVNTPLYTNTITSYVIPVSASIATFFGTGALKADGSNGTTSWTGTYPTYAGAAAQLSILGTVTKTSTLLGNLLGFTSGNYPSTASGLTSQTTSSNGNSLTASPPFPPLGSSVNGVILRCNMVENPVAYPTDIIDSFAITSPYGSNINYLPISNNMIKMKRGRFSNLTISFTDQNYNPLLMLDPNVLITLIINFP